MARVVTVFGGSGFIGRYVVRRLARAGARVNVVVRDVEAAKFLKTMGDVGQIALMRGSVTDSTLSRRAVVGSDSVINLVGILYQRGRRTFEAIHHQGAGNVAAASRAAGVQRLLQVSAIGADPGSAARYASSKAAGEAAVRSAFAEATIIRPSIVFGPEDAFFNRFAAMARMMPALPLIGGGRTRFQPVYVDDIAHAIVAALDEPGTYGKTYELGGPRIYSFKELMELILAEIGRKRLLAPVPFWLARLEAAFLEVLPVPPLTRDQVRLLERDNVVSPGAIGFEAFQIQPTAAEVILPTYLRRFRATRRLDPSGRPA
ncbi:MAG: complex I NDUFA9 subunit family protein [Proteobacteria bacterium]|nr:complex I NDUFA9 subunit family protein [Pseudomonadota bacterium]MBI3498496.1 complex I NDUFA9 subunit family protein [Pseudomonadota bacterium]